MKHKSKKPRTSGKTAEKSVITIRRAGNPTRLFNAGTQLRHLDGCSYEQIVDEFEKRLFNWYFNIADQLEQEECSDFVLTMICCITIDILSQYIYCKPASNKLTYQQFFKDYLYEYNFSIKPPIKTSYHHKGRWMIEEVDNVAFGFYHAFRCGVVHSGRILEYGRINRDDPINPISVRTWREDHQVGKEIVVNPVLLLAKLREIFQTYIAQLRDHDPKLKTCFISKFRMEYGISL